MAEIQAAISDPHKVHGFVETELAQIRTRPRDLADHAAALDPFHILSERPKLWPISWIRTRRTRWVKSFGFTSNQQRTAIEKTIRSVRMPVFSPIEIPEQPH